MKPLNIRKASKIVWRVRWRAVAAVMLPIYFFTSLPPGALEAKAAPDHPAPVLTPKNVHANKRKPPFTPYAGVRLPAQPTDQDITCSHAFPEPLVPVGAATTAEENQALGKAIKTYLKRKNDEDATSLIDFLAHYPQSAWRATLDLNLAELYFKTGNFSKALDAWQNAWDITQNLSDPQGKQTGNLAVAKLAKMKARIGRTDELATLFEQIKGRSFAGVAAQLLMDARSGLWLMQNRPQDAFRCGPSALQEISLATKHKIEHPEIIKQSQSTPQGVALSDVKTLSDKIGMPMQMAKRSAGAAFVVPAVVHWKLGHYAAIVGKRGDKYEIHDTTFEGAHFLVSAQALEQESSGYFLIPAGSLPSGWTSVSKKEGSGIFGRGNTNFVLGYAYTPDDCNSGGDCGSGGAGEPTGNPEAQDANGNNSADEGKKGATDSTANTHTAAPYAPDMTIPFVKSLLVSLNVVDTPAGYRPPVGPTLHFTVQYHQREIAQPTTFTYSNLGPNWTFSYLSYVIPGSSQSYVYVRGGGVETYNYNYSTGSYYPQQITQAVLKQVDPTTWTRTMKGGEVETYSQPDGSGKFFLSSITDPQGNSLALSYDAYLRIVAITDALGQVTSLTYGNSDMYKITKVTDPFGRYAQFDYDGNGRLQVITDILGKTSQMDYGDNNFVKTLTTPYGATKFSYGDILTDPSLGTARWINTTYPDGNKTRTEFRHGAPNIISTDSNGIPAGMYGGTGTNDSLEWRNTFYWDKQAMKDHPSDYRKALITHWLHTSDINTCSNIQESLLKPNQRRIWYGYAGTSNSYQSTDTMLARVTQRGRILDDGSTQLYQYEYNPLGKVTKAIDPVGRETDYVYASNNMDLLTVKQKNGAGYDILASYTYNTKHEPLTVTDASGETTTYTYYSNGQLHTVTDPQSHVTTYTYDTDGYLTNVTGPVSGASADFTYDGYGRVQTVTDSRGYVTTTDYDVMDRPTQITYPDGTTSQMVYNNFDLEMTKDRLGRWTHTGHSVLRQPVWVQDAAGHTVMMNWNLSGGVDSIVDAKGQITKWIYDGQNRVIEKDYPDGHKQQIAYEATTSRVKSTTDAKGQVATITYNADNSVAQVVYTNAAVSTPTVSFTYDPVYPRPATMVDGTGTTTYTYNAITGTPTLGAGRLHTIAAPLATTTLTYDELGRGLTQTVDDSSTGQGLSDSVSSVTYDALGRVDTISNALSGGGTFDYTYLAQTGRVASVTNPNGQSTVYTYEDTTTTPNEPRLSEIKNLDGSSAVISKFNYGYDTTGLITSWTQQTDSNHPENWAMAYDAEGKLLNANVTDTVSSAVLHQYAYTYDGASNRTSEQIDGNIVGSSYNNLNQLTGQSAGGSMVFSGALDEPATVTVGGNAATVDAGNHFRGLASVSTGTNTIPIIAHDASGNATTNNFQVVIPSNSSSYTYDLNGNMTSDGVHTYGWDAKNELVSIVYNSGPNSGNHTEFTYNGAGQRVKIVERSGTTIGSGTITSTKQFVFNEERDGSNNVTRRYFAQGEQRVSGSTTTNYFYTRDHLGSIREMIDDSGVIQARYSYDPYGRRTKVSGSLDCDRGYTGYYHHATSGLDLSATRPYDANLGRFIQRDPSGEGSGLNLYAYCADNPICHTDHSGLCMDSPPFDSSGGYDLDNLPPMENPYYQSLENGGSINSSPSSDPGNPADQWNPYGHGGTPPNLPTPDMSANFAVNSTPFGVGPGVTDTAQFNYKDGSSTNTFDISANAGNAIALTINANFSNGIEPGGTKYSGSIVGGDLWGGTMSVTIGTNGGASLSIGAGLAGGAGVSGSINAVTTPIYTPTK